MGPTVPPDATDHFPRSPTSAGINGEVRREPLGGVAPSVQAEALVPLRTGIHLQVGATLRVRSCLDAQLTRPRLARNDFRSHMRVALPAEALPVECNR